MIDKISQSRRSENMRRIRDRDTSPEMTVRRLTHSMGYRYRLRRKDLPGRPDLVFSGRRKVIFVHGCFWHQHPDPRCQDSRLPKSNTAYWTPKLRRNRERDQEHVQQLQAEGWRVLVIWECELKDTDQVVEKIRSFLG